ncbi:MAG: T9SS type A sorting domain-containing protein [Candidatus Eisenbacteria bacterium]
MFRSFLRGLALAAPAACLLALLATPSSAVQRTVTIYQIQDSTSVGHVVEGSTDTVTTTGIITGADTRPTGFGFYIQDAAGGFYSGVQVFTGGANVFADSGYARGDIITATGRVIEFQGGTEIASRTGSAFGIVPTTTKIGTAGIPAPLAATFSQVNELSAYAVGEKYEGVLVSLTGNARTARVPIYNSGTSAAFPAGQYLTVDASLAPGAALDSVRIDGQTLANPGVNSPNLGVVVSSVKGIANQSTRGYFIQLRDGADIVQPSPPALLNAWATSNTKIRLQFDRALDPTTANNAANYSRTTLKAIDSAAIVSGQNVDLTTTTDPQVPTEAEGVTASGVKSSLGVVMASASTQTFRAGISPITAVQTNYPVGPNHPVASDSSQFTFEQVTVRGQITARDGSLYYIQNGSSSNPSSGMLVFAPIDAMVRGDDVTISGTITEFGSASQVTEYSGLDYQFLNASGTVLPAPVVVTPGAIGPLTGVKPFPGERYEGMLVELQNAKVVQDSLPNGQFLMQGLGGAGDTVRVDDTMFRHQYLYSRGDNYMTVVPFLRGTVNDAFGQFTVNPRDSADISDQLVGVEPGTSALGFRLNSIAPTPVSFANGNKAVLRFNLPTAGKVTARVYDITGRLVAEPASDLQMAAGPQTLAIDGRSLSGNRFSSGIFFVQLKFGNVVATGKLVVAE